MRLTPRGRRILGAVGVVTLPPVGTLEPEELAEFAVQTDARCVVLTHGDPPARAWFAQKLSELMPNTRVLDPVPLQTYQV